MVHDSQSLKNWNGEAMPSIRKKQTVDVSFPLSETHDHARRKRTKISNASQFLVDGFSPINPHPRVLANRHNIASLGRSARRKLVDSKGFILQLIDEIYPPLICPECYHLSTARTEADQHIKSNHLGQKVFKCVSSSCTQVYSSKAGLQYHMEHAHQISRISDSSSFKFGSQSPSSSNKKADRQQQIKASAYSASSPSSTSIQNDSKKSKKPQLSALLEKKLNAVYPSTICPACNEEFKKKTHVIKHLVEVHHGEEPYKCIVSNCKRTKKYATREGLIYHLNIYHDNALH
ncbi:hypothetical protein MAM1_0559d10917 [Mucor ambiguus]|uniref:C2H2-type domain-containing protein n=1 Tax=Mucor ambiguus TaxID=91626 RepID=A0A0C9N9F5_9FUNG|nr:hypothetical protein MAM1_0559d10917 [Mucor ambiguus]